MSDVQARAEQAKRLLEDPLLVEAFANVRNAAVEVWAGSHTDDAAKREQAFYSVRALDMLRNELESIITNGAIAARRVQAPIR